MILRLLAHAARIRDALPLSDRSWLGKGVEIAAELWSLPARHGHAADYEAILQALEDLAGGDAAIPSIQQDGSIFVPGFKSAGPGLEKLLARLKPWRKGPWTFGEVFIDTEWRSDAKWERLEAHLPPLHGRRVLDVGCGSGYHLWRIALLGASVCVGLEPFLLSCAQFAASTCGLEKLAKREKLANLPESPASPLVLPLTLEECPSSAWFDTVLSMGLLSHQRSPFDHLLNLKKFLRPGGQLVLENLIVTDRQLLVPVDRYAKMRNVWFIPSPAELETWLERAGFTDIRCVDISRTTAKEQRRTAWMEFESLGDFLDPDDALHTLEGYPAPQRAIFTANKPA